MFASTFRSQPRSCHGPALGERRASAAVSRMSCSAKNGASRSRNCSLALPVRTPFTNRRPIAACTRLRRVSFRGSSPAASTDVPAVQCASEVVLRESGYGGSARCTVCPARFSSPAASRTAVVYGLLMATPVSGLRTEAAILRSVGLSGVRPRCPR